MRVVSAKILLVSAWSCSIGVSFAFTPSTTWQHCRPSTVLQSTKDRIKSAGGGIPVLPPGNNALFDPGLEGMAGGTSERIAQASQYRYLPPTATTETPPPPADLVDCQNWLEDIGLPLNFAKPQSPVQATVLGRAKLIDDSAPGDIQHIVLKLPPGMHYVEGQSLSVIPPGLTNGKKHKPRLYSIASTRYGDLLDGQTVSLCVRRAEYVEPATGLVDPSKQGVCSNFLCNASPGTLVDVAGPVGKTMLLPEDPTTELIFVATGTGIAPFRAFLHRLFMEETVARHMFQGTVWLILGVPTTGGLLYPEEFKVMQERYPNALRVDYAISREMNNRQGGKLYVQHVLAENAETLFSKLNQGANIYFCGLKGMMPGILDALEQVAISKGVDWSTKLKELQANHQWHVEVY